MVIYKNEPCNKNWQISRAHIHTNDMNTPDSNLTNTIVAAHNSNICI